MIFCFSLKKQVPKIVDIVLDISPVSVACSLDVGRPGGIRVDSKKGGKYGCQDRLHDMPQEAQETAGRKAINLQYVKRVLSRDLSLLLQAIKQNHERPALLDAGLCLFSRTCRTVG